MLVIKSRYMDSYIFLSAPDCIDLNTTRSLHCDENCMATYYTSKYSTSRLLSGLQEAPSYQSTPIVKLEGTFEFEPGVLPKSTSICALEDLRMSIVSFGSEDLPSCRRPK